MVTLSRTIFGFFSLVVLASYGAAAGVLAGNVAATGATLGLLVLALVAATGFAATVLEARFAAVTRFFAAALVADKVAVGADFLVAVLAGVDAAAAGVDSMVAMGVLFVRKVK